MIRHTQDLRVAAGSWVTCGRCGATVTQLAVVVEDDDTDNEQYVCAECVTAILAGAPLGRMTLEHRDGKIVARLGEPRQ